MSQVTTRLRDQHGNVIAILGAGLTATFPSTTPDLEPWVPDLVVSGTPIIYMETQSAAVEVDVANAAIALKAGNVFITKGSAAADTLAAPTVGTDDGKLLTIMGLTAFAHTVTTPASGINGNKHIGTFSAVGDILEVVAYQGVWYTTPRSNVTLS